MENIPSKTCTLCGQAHPATLEFFQKQTRGKYGIASWCRPCANEHAKKRREAGKKSPPTLPIGAEQICRGCGVSKPCTPEYFYKSPSAPNGFEKQCKSCRNERMKLTAEKDPESFRKRRSANQLKRRSANLEAWRERERRQKRKERAADPEKAKAYFRSYRAANREKYLRHGRAWRASVDWNARGRAWRAANPEKVAATNQKMRAKRAMAEGSFTKQDIDRLWDMQKGRCHWQGPTCEDKLSRESGKRFHVDHRIPLSKGGKNDASNIVLACPACNHKKWANMPWEFTGRLL